MSRAMPQETDRARLELIARVLLSAPPDVLGEVWFEERAHAGSAAETDDIGMTAIFPTKISRTRQERLLREALAEHIRTGRKVTRVEVAGVTAWGKDPELRYEFRMELRGQRVYVKIVFDGDDTNEPVIIVKKVGRWN